MSKKDQRIRLLITAAAIAVLCLLCYYIGKPMLRFVSEPEKFRAWIRETGAWGIAAFVLMNSLQVFAAVIPGGPFSAAAGYAFGPFWGIVICLLTTSTASMAVLLLIRRFGPRILRFFTDKSPEELNLFKRTEHLEQLFLALFLIPGSPKDVMTYAAALTNVSPGWWLVINLIGRIPGIALSVLGGNSLSRGQYGLAIGLSVLSAVVYGAGAILYKKKTKQQ